MLVFLEAAQGTGDTLMVSGGLIGFSAVARTVVPASSGKARASFRQANLLGELLVVPEQPFLHH